MAMLTGCGQKEVSKGDEGNKSVLSSVEDEDEGPETDGETEGKAGVEDGAGISQSDQDPADPEKEEADSGTKEPITMGQLLGNGDDDGIGDGETSSDTVLWFNATYAPLTYSNGGNWRLVGGMELSEYNESLEKVLLKRDWDVVDRESAMETIEWLREEGQRETFRNYRKELEEMELLDTDVNVFMETLTNSDMEGYLFRYVIIYSLYQSGLDEDAMAAWDLCRINQLCGHFYICGYMTYEEAMDISLENSRILQEKYSSWDELMNSYILGYQFWKSDPCATEDSPTLQRYHYYEILLEMKDGPYSLDWDTELKKEW